MQQEQVVCLSWYCLDITRFYDYQTWPTHLLRNSHGFVAFSWLCFVDWVLIGWACRQTPITWIVLLPCLVFTILSMFRGAANVHVHHAGFASFLPKLRSLCWINVLCSCTQEIQEIHMLHIPCYNVQNNCYKVLKKSGQNFKVGPFLKW